MTLLTKTMHYKILFLTLLALLLSQPQIAYGVAYGDAGSAMSQPQLIQRESNEVITGNPDTDGDGLDDSVEISIGTNPNDADSDDDGALDGQETNPGTDSDGDGLINGLDADSDNDGLFDGTEMGLSCSNLATDLSVGACRPDSDAGATTTDLLDADSDNGGVSDGSEDYNLNGQVDPGETDPTAGHGADDATGIDSDSDGLSDDLETTLGSDSNDADSDDDGVLDGTEANPSSDSDGDGVINALDPDSDNDGLFDGTEMGLSCSNPATDLSVGACRPDSDAGATTTNPLDADSDNGGVNDGSEDYNLNGQIDPGETDPTTGQGADDSTVTDSDGDGLSDNLEATLGTNPNDTDSDDDGALDGQETNPGTDSDGDGLINGLDADSDNDNLFDGTELGNDCSNVDTDALVGNCIADGDSGATVTSMLLADSDGGGVGDGQEDQNKNGIVDGTESNPTVGNAADDSLNLHCFSEITGDNTTDFSSADASAVQQAVSIIGAGGTVKVAGICAGVQMISGTLQSAVITQNLTLAGGYTTTNWLATNDPVANPTILDALQAGRVIVVNADGVTVDALTIRNGLSSGSFGNNDGGGVLVNAGNTFTLSRSLVQDNSTSGNFGSGAGVAVVSGTGVVTGSSLISNSTAAFGNGGGFFVDNGATGWIYNSSFYTNTSSQGGAAVSRDMHVSGSYFEGNVSAGNGGALLPGNLLFVTDTVFFNNTANHGGGAAYPLEGAYVENSQFISNTAGIQGGALRAQNGFLVIRNSEFYSNVATAIPYTGDGGAVQGSNYGSQPSILENNIFQGNSAAGQGGAASFEAGSGTAIITITANLFVSNDALNGGGALHFGNGAQAFVDNNMFALNQGGNGADGIELGITRQPGVSAALAGLTNDAPNATNGGSSTPAEVSGWFNSFASITPGSGVALRSGTSTDGESLSLSNTIIDGFASGATVGAQATSIVLDGVLWHDVTTLTAGANITVTNAITGDPLFVNRAAGDLHIQSGSAALDAGVISNIATDYDGEARPQGAGYELGADETLSIQVSLTVTTTGTGTGTVLLNPAGASYDLGTVVTVTANADLGSTFAGWSGACNDAINPCVVTMTAAQSLTATFTLNSYALITATAGNGSGLVTLNPAGGTYDHGTVVMVTANADLGSTFAGWSGACNDAINPCVVTMTAANILTATFTLNSYALITATAGNGSGLVTLNPAGGTYDHGTVVMVTATADAGSIFAGWSGACSGNGSCNIVMDAAKTVTATFDLLPPNQAGLTVNTVGNGLVTSIPAGVDCGFTCTVAVTQGSQITLTATADVGNSFSGWSGVAACTTDPICVVTMDANRTVTATFALIPPDLQLSFTSQPPDGASVGVGNTITYHVQVTNTGGVANGVVLTVTLPDHVSLVPGSVNPPTSTVTFLSAASFAAVDAINLQWAVGTLQTNERYEATFVVVVNQAIDIVAQAGVSAANVNGAVLQSVNHAAVPTAMDEDDEPTANLKLFLPVVSR